MIKYAKCVLFGFLFISLFLPSIFANVNINCSVILNLNNTQFHQLIIKLKGTPLLNQLADNLHNCYLNNFCNDTICARKLMLRRFSVNAFLPPANTRMPQQIVDHVEAPITFDPTIQKSISPSLNQNSNSPFDNINWQ